MTQILSKDKSKQLILAFNQVDEGIVNLKFPSTQNTVAQYIPKLPASKFFRKILNSNSSTSIKSPLTSHSPADTQPILNSNTSANQLCSISSGTFNNLSTNNLLSKETSVNLSSLTQQQNRNFKWTEVSLPIRPEQVLSRFLNKLTSYEAKEILSYPLVWFIGAEGKKVDSNESALVNYGFDNEAADLIVHVHDHIAYRYEVFEILGKGSFGQVFKAFDHKHKTFIALKVIKNKQRFNQQAAIEIEILKYLRKKDNLNSIVHILSSFTFRGHICICFELLSMNLYQFLKINKFQGLSMGLIKRFSVQTLQALTLIHQLNVIHCDLKPENIMLKHSNKSTIKVIDFGSSCQMSKRIYTYIQSRFYRAPEVILGIPYTSAIDIWSFGCIIVELFTGHPIFAGENESHQLLCIIRCLGQPPEEVLAQSKRKKVFFDCQSRIKIQNDSKFKKPPPIKSIAEILFSADPEFTNLVERCLTWDPKARITAQEALKLNWLSTKT